MTGLQRATAPGDPTQAGSRRILVVGRSVPFDERNRDRPCKAPPERHTEHFGVIRVLPPWPESASWALCPVAFDLGGLRNAAAVRSKTSESKWLPILPLRLEAPNLSGVQGTVSLDGGHRSASSRLGTVVVNGKPTTFSMWCRPGA
jgi:hypothetical protein